MVLAEDAHYPRAREQLTLVTRQIAQKEYPKVTAPPAMAPAPTKRASKSLIVWIPIVIVVIIVLAIILYWFLMSGWLT